MWVTVFHMIEWPVAVACGYAAARLASARGASIWLAYVGVLAAGVGLNLLGGLPDAPSPHPWGGFLIWASWSAFGAVQGWRGERDRGAAVKS